MAFLYANMVVFYKGLISGKNNIRKKKISLNLSGLKHCLFLASTKSNTCLVAILYFVIYIWNTWPQCQLDGGR